MILTSWLKPEKRGWSQLPSPADEIEGLVKELVQPPEVIQRMQTFLQN